MFEKLDGTGRQPRKIQTEVFEVLEKEWKNYQIFVLNVGVGTGKSFIARAIQKQFGGHIITSQNILIDQYINIYPDVNFLKGAAHYQCIHNPEWSCEDYHEYKEHYCDECPYKRAKTRAAMEDTFFNPLSLYYCREVAPKDVRIVDEAHSLLSFLREIASKDFKQSIWKFPIDVFTEVGFLKFLSKKVKQYHKLMQQTRKLRDPKKFKMVAREYKSLNLLHELYSQNPQHFVLSEKMGNTRGKPDRILRVSPLFAPRHLLDRVLGTDNKIVLMSGTMFSEDIKELIGNKPYKFIDLPQPIPVENRQIKWLPLDTMNKDTPISAIGNQILKVLKKHPSLNTIIHVTYARQLALHFYLKDNGITTLINTSEDKDDILNTFKEKGGIWLAAGCSEGLDLSYDIARLNIIPSLDMPNLGDEIVLKRKAAKNGQVWYDQQTLKQLIQRVGRTTRADDDSSITYCFDPLLPTLINRLVRGGEFVPPDFIKSIQFY